MAKVKFTYAVAHGTAKKGEVRELYASTAKALEKHKIGKAGAAVKAPSVEEDGEAGAIGAGSGS